MNKSVRGSHIDPMLGFNLEGDLSKGSGNMIMEHDSKKVLMEGGNSKKRSCRDLCTGSQGRGDGKVMELNYFFIGGCQGA